MNVIFLGACAILFAVPVWFVVHQDYNDGLIGRIALLGISFAAATFIMEASLGDSEYTMLPQTVMLTGFAALYFVWKMVRFRNRILKQKKHLEIVHSGVTRERRSQWI